MVVWWSTYCLRYRRQSSFANENETWLELLSTEFVIYNINIIQYQYMISLLHSFWRLEQWFDNYVEVLPEKLFYILEVMYDHCGRWLWWLRNCHFCPRIRMCISTILFAVYRLFFSSKLHRMRMAVLYIRPRLHFYVYYFACPIRFEDGSYLWWD